jgi:hypothetical protein
VPVFVLWSPIVVKNVAMWFLKRDRESWKYEIRIITRHIAESPWALAPILPPASLWA